MVALDRRSLVILIAGVFIASLVSSLLYSSYSDSVSLSYGNSPLFAASPPLITYFTVDHFYYPVFERELAAGNLPNIQKLIRTGGWIKKGLTTFPSITGYAFFPLLTGESAARSNIFGLRWFDRNRTEDNFRNYVGSTFKYLNEDLSPDYKLLFEEFPNEYTYSVNSYVNNGVKEDRKTPWYMATAKYGPRKWYFRLAKLFGGFGYQDWKGFETNVMHGLIKDAIEKRPKVQWVTLASPDGSQHVTGTDDLYVELVRHVDYLIGLFVDAAEADGSLKDRLLILASDHGGINVDYNLDLEEIFARVNVAAYDAPAMTIAPFHFSTHVSWYTKQGFDVIVAINGNSMVYLYFSNPDFRQTGTSGEEWSRRLLPEQITNYPAKSGHTVNLYESLKCVLGIEFVMGLSTHTHSNFILDDPKDSGMIIEIHNCHSSGLVHRHQDKWAYVVATQTIDHPDPFNYLADPHVSEELKNAVRTGKYLSRSEWLEMTLDSQYPLGPVLAEDIISMPKSGDVLVTSEFNYDFGKDYEWFLKNNRGGHGGIHRNQTVVPMVLNGWGVKPGSTVECGTTSDLGATIRHIAGLDQFDGAAGNILHSLIDQERLNSRNKH